MRISDWSSDVCSSDLMGHLVDTFVILAVVVVNVVIGFVQEGKAEKALQAIRHLLAPHAVVLRDGRQQDRSEERRVGKECVIRVDLGGRRILKNKNKK